MKGRLTLEKVNAAVDDMASFAEANAQLLSAPRKKVGGTLCARHVIENSIVHYSARS
jgi:hypothetical protein